MKNIEDLYINSNLTTDEILNTYPQFNHPVIIEWANSHDRLIEMEKLENELNYLNIRIDKINNTSGKCIHLIDEILSDHIQKIDLSISNLVKLLNKMPTDNIDEIEKICDDMRYAIECIDVNSRSIKEDLEVIY